MTDPYGLETTLGVIDATLAGEPVEPEFAELAELSLILRAERPPIDPGFAAGLDRRVARRFADETPRIPGRAGRLRRSWLFVPGVAAGLTAVIAVIIVLAGDPGGSSTSSFSSSSAVNDAARASSGAAATATSAGTAKHAPGAELRALSPAAGKATAGSNPGLAAAPSAPPAPATAGRKVVQSAQLQLSTRPSRIDDVAQQVYDVVAQQNGVVESSNVNASAGYGNARFSLSVPSANLARALSALSQLHGANVVSRSDASQDITGQVGGAGRGLAEARALRASLLKQLAAAATNTAVDSLKAQIRDVDATIDRDLAALNGLNHKVAVSQIDVTINSVTPPIRPVAHGGAGFTLGHAWHDAGRVLVVAAGAALIALAVLLPLGLLVALGLWVGALVRRRRREQILDLL
jgi:hypothetical protein